MLMKEHSKLPWTTPPLFLCTRLDTFLPLSVNFCGLKCIISNTFISNIEYFPK